MDNKKCILLTLCCTPVFASAHIIGESHMNGKTNHAYDTNVADTSRVYDIDEIVVSSQPKDLQRLRRQAVSSTSLSAKTLAAFATRDMRDVATRVPSFVMPCYGTRYTSSVYVRGIGSRVNNPAIGMYVDDIPMVSKSAFNTHLYDLSRIDILRGPQGTLYGQNAEGGLVRVYTKSPLTYQGTDAKLSFGSHMWRMAQISHYNKVEGVGAYSLSAFYNGQNGFQRNQYNNHRADDGNEAGARLKFMRQQTDRTLISLAADYQWVRQNGFAYGDYDLTTRRASAPSTNKPNSYRRHLASVGLTVNYRGVNADINSTTSYQYLDDSMLMDQDYMPIDYMSLGQRQLLNAITQEFAIKNHDDKKWRRVTGAFFSYQWLRTNAPVNFGEGITTPMGNAIANSIYQSIMKSMTDKGMSEQAAKAIIDKAGGVSMNVGMDVPGLFRTPQLNAAIFHESSLKLGDRLKATLGLRYDFSRVAIDYDTRATMTLAASVMGVKATNNLSSHLASNAHNAYNQLLPKIGLTYELGENDNSDNGSLGNIYLSASKGYRAGGYNIQMFSDILQSELMANRMKAMRDSYDVPHTDDDYAKVNNTIAYKPETSWNYEVGAHLNLFESSLHLDIAAYLMQIKNQQLSVMAGTYGFGRMMVNAGRSRSLGGEITLRGSALSNALAWAVAYGYTNATFRSYEDNNSNYRGNHVPYIPSHTLSANADYTLLTNGTCIKSLTFGAGLTAQGDIYWDEANSYKQKFYALLNAHALAQFSGFSLNLWAKNLTNTKYCTFAMDSSASGEKHYFGQKGMPVMVGVDVNVNF